MSGWHRIREGKVKERTALVNQIRALLSEQGITLPQGITHVRKQLPGIIENLDNNLSACARDYLSELYGELVECDALVDKNEFVGSKIWSSVEGSMSPLWLSPIKRRGLSGRFWLEEKSTNLYLHK
jgi:hypothetical protein